MPPAAPVDLDQLPPLEGYGNLRELGLDPGAAACAQEAVDWPAVVFSLMVMAAAARLRGRILRG